MAGDNVKHLTDAEFDEYVLKASLPSLVDFWAPWCGPCHQYAPVLEAFAKTNSGKVKVFKLDVEDNPKTAEKYGIRGIPTTIFFKHREPVDISSGAVSQTTLQKKLDTLLRD